MKISFQLLVPLLLILFFGILQVIFFRVFAKGWWEHKIIRRISWSLPLIGTLMLIVWGIGRYYGLIWLSYPGAILVAIVFLVEIALVFSLPFSGVIHLSHFLTEKYVKYKIRKNPEIVDSNRRAFLRTAAAAFPIVAVSSSVSGISSSFSEAQIVEKTFKFKNLPDDLDGFKILQISDMHVKHYITLEDVSAIVEKSKEIQPDLILVTGDVSDNLSLLPEILKILEEANPPHGIYASLGNHEYYRGIGRVYDAFNKSSIPLLVDSGESIKVGNSQLFIGGVDDPVVLGGSHLSSVADGFYQNSINKVMSHNSGNDFTVLMSHRPRALDYAAEKSVPLILSGHTHGGQVGFMGRSILEPFYPESYLWGEYRKKDSILYTTCGMGHWFPFRIACPPEAPLITLKKA